MAFTFRSFCAAFLLPAVIAATAIPATHAQEADAGKANVAKVRKDVAAFLGIPETVVESVIHIPQGGLYEVLLNNGEMFYTDKAVSYLILGRIIDTKTRKDLTGERLDKLSRIDFKALPLGQAIKRKNGNGQRVIVTFEDPNCGYCKRLGQELQKVKNVTIYTFLFPILSDDSVAKSRHIWCAENKAATWVSWIVDGKKPEARNCDSTAIDRNQELGRKLRITGTPVLFFANGMRIAGYREALDMEQILEEISAETGK